MQISLDQAVSDDTGVDQPLCDPDLVTPDDPAGGCDVLQTYLVK